MILLNLEFLFSLSCFKLLLQLLEQRHRILELMILPLLLFPLLMNVQPLHVHLLQSLKCRRLPLLFFKLHLLSFNLLLL